MIEDHERELLLRLMSCSQGGYHEIDGQQFSVWKSPDGKTRALLCGRLEILMKKLVDDHQELLGHLPVNNYG